MVLYDSALTLPEQDRLGRQGFARFLAQSILAMDASEPFVFGLQGSWGSGKSSVLNFVRFYLENPKLLGDSYSELPPILIVDFNPWWFSGSDQLLAEFFRQFRSQIGSKADSAEKLKELSGKLELFAKILTPLTWIPTMGPIAEGARKGIESATSAMDSAAENLAKDVNKSKEAICAILREQDTRILVILDDLDRLRADELRQMFQVVKAVADFPKTIYLLSYDPTAVVEGLNKSGVHAPAQYLEKIVQAPFDLPEPDSLGLRGITGEHIDKLIASTPKELWNLARWKHFYFGGLDVLLRGPRDVKRLFNILRPAYPPVCGEVDLVDFIAIHAIRIFAPSVFRFIVGNRGLMTDSDLMLVLDESEQKEGRIRLMKSVLESVDSHDRDAVNTIMETLFPIWEPQTGRYHFSDGSHSDWRREKRICSVDFFDFYFRLSIPDGAIPSYEVKAILELANSPSAFREALVRIESEMMPGGVSKLEKFLKHAPDYIKGSATSELVGHLVNGLYSCGDRLFNKLERQQFPFQTRDWQLFRLVLRAFEEVRDSASRFKIAKDAFTTGDALSLMSLSLLVWIEKAEGKGDPIQRPLFSLEETTELMDVFIHKVEDSAANGSLRNTPYLDRVLGLWASHRSREKTIDYTTTLASDDSGLADIVVGAMTSLWLSSSGSGHTSEPKFVAEYTGLAVEDVAARCEACLAEGPEWMTELRRVAMESFVAVVRDT